MVAPTSQFVDRPSCEGNHQLIIMSAPPSDERPRNLSGAAVLAGFVVAVVAMMIVPLPTPLLDVLITTNLALSVALLLVAIYSARTLELSTFPTLLVLTTLFRLSLNVSSVRLILLQANAGRVIHAFGAFVVRGDYVVGFAVFLILTIVQYVVISRGAERVAEVAARFTLDAMPGQQLAIDADVRAGAIDAEEARLRRGTLSKEAQLYGALDGAMRFVKGDAIAGILILSISLAGGLVIGILERGMGAAQAARIYTLLTIGDGLVSQLPALIISTAAGLVVTRVASDEAGANLGRDLARQLLRSRALLVTALLLFGLALVPGLPLWPFALVGVGVAGLAWYARKAPEAPLPAASLPRVAPALEVAVDPQLRVAWPALGEELPRIGAQLADELGVMVPPVTLTVDARLALRSYEVRLRGMALGSGQVPDGRMLADSTPAALPAGIDAVPAEHPATGALAAWIPASAQAAVAAAGVTVHDGASCVSMRLESLLRAYAPELVGLDETQRLLDAASRSYPSLVREVVPRRVDTATLAEVLRRLVAEGLPIGDLRDVLEAVARLKEPERDAAALTERVRACLKRQITSRHARGKRVEALLLDSDAEEAVRGAIRQTQDGAQLALEPELADAFLQSVTRESMKGGVIVTSSDLRRHVRRLVADEHPQLPVIAYHELLPDVQVERVGTITLLDAP
jgi:type III secretion protein V